MRTKQCFECKQPFRKEELVDYCREGSNTPHSFCAKCLEEVQSRERLQKEVCRIFGLLAPSPRVNKERTRLREAYGYTNDTITECLKYVYDVEHAYKGDATLCLVTPAAMERMIQYKRTKQVETEHIAQAMDTQYKTFIVPLKKEKEKEKDTSIDFDALFID